jgi:hypothetical protein
MIITILLLPLGHISFRSGGVLGGLNVDRFDVNNLTTRIAF